VFPFPDYPDMINKTFINDHVTRQTRLIQLENSIRSGTLGKQNTASTKNVSHNNVESVAGRLSAWKQFSFEELPNIKSSVEVGFHNGFQKEEDKPCKRVVNILPFNDTQ
jgi:hypothetical protein